MKRPVSEKILRQETECMIECFMDELFSTFGKKEIIGIYLVGSVNKKWDSKIDYIPGMSDVDLNIYVKDPRIIEKYSSDMSKSLRFSKNCEKNFLKRIPRPAHIPRLQAQLHNMFLEKYPDNLAPKSSVRTIYGVPYENCIPKGTLGNKSREEQIADVKRQMLSNEIYLKSIPFRVVSANSYRLIRYLDEIYYKTCSSASQILCLDMDTKTVMCLNKTTVIKNLKSSGYKELAREYGSMLKNSYSYWLNDDIDSARKAILSGYNALILCEKIVKDKN